VEPHEISRGLALVAVGGDGIAHVTLVTFIFVIPPTPWHQNTQFVICAIIVYQDVWVSVADHGFLMCRFGGQIFKKASIVKSAASVLTTSADIGFSTWLI
jgi:hypothetical protein